MLIKKNTVTTAKERTTLQKETPKSSKPESRGLLDTFKSRYDGLNVHLDQPEYQNVDHLSAAKMLGHFTQKMQNQGYPWKIHQATAGSDGSFKKGEALSDLEAFKSLENGQPLLLQPMRDLQLDLSSGSITALAAAGSLGGAEVTSLGNVANYSKTTQVNAGSQGISVKFGEPLVITNFAELKLLNQMYDSDQKIEGQSDTAKVAHQLSYFTQKTVGSAYPWRFFVKDDSNVALRVTKAATKGVSTGGALGAVVGGAIGGLLALGFRNFDYLLGAAVTGAALGAARGGYDAVHTSLKGTPVNAVDALKGVLGRKEVVFQETRARSIGLPIVGKISWFSDHGKGSGVSSPEDLNTFYYMQSGEELPKPKAVEKKTEPVAPTLMFVDQSVHNHYQANAVEVGVYS